MRLPEMIACFVFGKQGRAERSLDDKRVDLYVVVDEMSDKNLRQVQMRVWFVASAISGGKDEYAQTASNI